MYPIDAFIYASPADLQPGSLVKARGKWSLRVTGGLANRAFEGLVVLEGPAIGGIVSVDGLGPGLALHPGYRWGAFVENLNTIGSGNEGYEFGALAIADGRQGIFANRGNDPDLTTIFALNDGSVFETETHMRAVAKVWDAHLVREDRRDKPIAKLFSVDLRALAGQ